MVFPIEVAWFVLGDLARSAFKMMYAIRNWLLIVTLASIGCDSITIAAEKTIYLFATEENESSFARIELIDDGHINLYVPYPDSFRDAVKSGSLTGVVSAKVNDHFNVKITTDAKFMKALASATAHVQCAPTQPAPNTLDALKQRF